MIRLYIKISMFPIPFIKVFEIKWTVIHKPPQNALYNHTYTNAPSMLRLAFKRLQVMDHVKLQLNPQYLYREIPSSSDKEFYPQQHLLSHDP